MEKKIPPKCRDLFRSCANTVGHAAATGDESSIKALKVMARVILHKIRGGKKKVTAIILKRLEKWERGEFQDLLTDLFVADEWSEQRSSTSHVSFEEGRGRRVSEKIAVGELSKAIQTQMSPAPYTGDMDKLEVLHPPRPDDPFLPVLPEEIAPPSTTPEDFFKAVCSASRATCQTCDGWHTDLLKAINIAPSEECPDPMFGLREFAVAFASGFLPVSSDLYLTLAGSKLAALAKPGTGDPRPVGIRGVFDRIGQRTLSSSEWSCYSSTLRVTKRVRLRGEGCHANTWMAV